MSEAPKRIQLSRAKGWRMPENTVKVDRTTRYGNPFKVTEDRTEADVAMAFHTWLTVDSCHAGIPERRAALLAALPQLRGKNLACWCKLGEPCHADVLLELANADSVSKE
jgi:hypothetical protein